MYAEFIVQVVDMRLGGRVGYVVVFADICRIPSFCQHFKHFFLPWREVEAVENIAHGCFIVVVLVVGLRNRIQARQTLFAERVTVWECAEA